MFIVFAGGAVCGKSRGTEVSARVRLGEKVLKLTDAAAVWDAGNKKLAIYFFPFKLNHSDIAKIKSGQAWLIGFGKKSPDTKLFPGWCPTASVKIEFRSAVPSAASAEFANFIFFGIEKNNYTANLNLTARRLNGAIQTLSIKNGILTFRSSSAGSVVGKEYKWDYSAVCPVYTVKK
jgi:hypothetical protein